MTEKIKKGSFQIVLLSPEALFHDKRRSLLSSTVYRDKLKTIVVDEAHVVEDWYEYYSSNFTHFSITLQCDTKSSFIKYITVNEMNDEIQKCTIFLPYNCKTMTLHM